MTLKRMFLCLVLLGVVGMLIAPFSGAERRIEAELTKSGYTDIEFDSYHLRDCKVTEIVQLSFHARYSSGEAVEGIACIDTANRITLRF